MDSRESESLTAIERLIARDEVRQLLSLYSHGIDRCDEEELKKVFWPDATCDYGTFSGNAWEFATGLIAALRELDRTQHLICNVVIDVTSATTARAQTSVLAYHELPDEDGRPIVRVVGGRYLDRAECRNGEWRLAERLYLMDWNQNGPDTGDWKGWIYGALNKGDRFPADPSRTWFD
ncbi:hypothetical protein GCM10011371_25670 [Novosphingobium marinum]|uniref:SnoaL-like domain-containing protein n=1 Tax=Novosphingobium marinum TaxID=1514948 RepID=A0A7Z0BU56_9SPHN|nr:nuclear transport factor 2 family protein [Novosphingobium marinum]NYH94818.1 hypothetical protein [Novosphingobium marinum]GGC37100.1 hypothetical protein GCM10011371_25670 [Novosphingobium marinum]